MATKSRKHEDFTKAIELILSYFVFPRGLASSCLSRPFGGKNFRRRSL